MQWKVDKLLAGQEIVSREPGNSMTPLIRSRQPVRITPTTWKDVAPGDIVFCRVKGYFYTHLVKAADPTRGCLISNNHGHVNGWTRSVYGKVVEILKMP